MYRAAVIGLGRMGSTFDDEMTQGGAIYLPYAHAPSYVASPQTELVQVPIHMTSSGQSLVNGGQSRINIYTTTTARCWPMSNSILSVSVQQHVCGRKLSRMPHHRGCQGNLGRKTHCTHVGRCRCDGSYLSRSGRSLGHQLCETWNPSFSQARLLGCDREQDDGLEDAVVALVDRVDEQRAESRTGEDVLDDHGAADEVRDDDPRHGDRGDRRVRQLVPDHDLAPRRSPSPFAVCRRTTTIIS